MTKKVNLILVAVCASLTLSACVLSPGPGGYGVEVAPALPALVVLGPDSYYYHGGYHYYYQNNGWSYSRERTGVRRELPRSQWPREIRYERDRGERGSERRGERYEGR